MPRGTFLVIEVEQPEGLSTRKLVIETAKHNVLTAYTGEEGLELFRKYPVDAVVIHADIRDIPCDVLAQNIRRERPNVPIVVITPSQNFSCAPADRVLSSHDPEKLLRVLQSIYAEHIKPPAA